MNVHHQNLSVVRTADGSDTIVFEGTKVSYHSMLGALKESRQVFVKNGLHFSMLRQAAIPLRIFEMGFGTGLNTLLTAMEAARTRRAIDYTVVEIAPLQPAIATSLNYGGLLGQESLYKAIHESAWEEPVALSPNFTILKLRDDFLKLTDADLSEPYNLVYWDAFAPEDQPELWTEETFQRIADIMHPGGVLVTYCSKTTVRRALEAAGFTVEKLEGPPGKRDVVRAVLA